MLIFIAGPISAPSIEAQQRHVDRAMLAGYELLQRGHHPFIPHLTHYFDLFITAFVGDPPTYEQYLDWSQAILRRCDALLYLAPSPGADRELALAEELGMPVWRDVDEIPRAA